MSDIKTEKKLTDHPLQKNRQKSGIHIKEGPENLEMTTNNIQTELQQREAALRQFYQAQKFDAIGSLAGGIAHDFNNILTVIQTCSQLAMEERSDKKNVYGKIEKILKASERAQELIKQILTLSKKHNISNFMAISIDPIIKDIINFLKLSHPPHIFLDYQRKTDNTFISGNASDIHQVILNLCTNAIHAMEKQEKGTLRILLRLKELSEDELNQYMPLSAGKYLRLTVKDTGEGIAPSLIDRIFDPYFTTKGAVRGKGLGLAMTLGIVQKHHGIIHVDSDLHQGTTFDVYFPMIEKIRKPHSKEKTSIHKGKETILLVDDERDVLQTVQLLLNHLGYKVFAFVNPIKALDEFKKNPEPYDLLIADLAMPEMNGKQLAKEINKIRKDLPILISSGENADLSKNEMNQLGINGYLMKPFLKKDLSESIKQALSVSGK